MPHDFGPTFADRLKADIQGLNSRDILIYEVEMQSIVGFNTYFVFDFLNEPSPEVQAEIVSLSEGLDCCAMGNTPVGVALHFSKVVRPSIARDIVHRLAGQLREAHRLSVDVETKEEAIDPTASVELSNMTSPSNSNEVKDVLKGRTLTEFIRDFMGRDGGMIL